MSVGESPNNISSRAKVTGAAQYPADRFPADALVAKVVFTDQPHARLVALDTRAAEATDGVLFVLTSADVPVNEYGLTMFDQPVFIGLDHTGRSTIPCDVSRWEADHLALVVAESIEAAEAGAAAIQAEWDQLPIVADIDEALADDAPLVHAENGLPGNTYESMKIRKGDMEAGWAMADVVVETTYTLPYQEHAYLQPEAAVSYIDENDRVTVEVAGQWTHEDREQVAHALGLDEEQVRIIYPAIGGAFGGREDTSLQIVLALAARKVASLGLNRAVTSRWSREESIVGHHKRHRGRIHTKWGATNEGRIVAVESEAWLDAGAYNYTSNKVLGNCHLGQAGAYEIDNVCVDSHAVYTNAIPGGAFRGFGGPQAAFAAESQVNRLAVALNMSPIEIRRINTLREGSIGITQVFMPEGVTLPEVIDRCAAEADFEVPMQPAGQGFSPFASLGPSQGALLRGRGFACAFKNVGFSFGSPESSDSEIILSGDGEEPTHAQVFYAGADVGQGTHTTCLQMTADATGVPFANVTGEFSDTATARNSGSASASRLTWMSGNAILGAAEEAEKAWLNGERPAVGTFRFVAPPTETLDPETGKGQPNFTYGYVAQAIEITVDRETGHIVVDRVVSTHDVGKAINPALVVGQIEGGVVQGHGYALSERLRVEDGRVLNPRFSGYLIPGIGDIPTVVESVVLELADPLGPFGARGMAEMPMMTYTPALAAALHDATGIWFDEFPLTPDRVRAALS
jgi:CO/xanthine dehydrogenase Mo-binding subunit